jgi:hypothetical protein
MPTQGTETAGLGAAAKEVAGHASSIARLELRLAAAELKEKVAALGLGVGLGAGAAVCALFALGFAAATIAAALALLVSTWLALLIVTAGFGGLAALLGAMALAAFRRGTPPVPKQAIEEAKLTTEAVRGNGSHAVT